MSRRARNWQPELRRFLGLYGRRPEYLGLKVLRGGDDNLNLLVKADEEKLVLRQYMISSESEIGFELELIRFLGEHHFPTAPLLSCEDGSLWAHFDGRPAALFLFVPGEHRTPRSAQAAEKVAAAIASLHQVTRGLVLGQPRSRTDLNRLRKLVNLVATRGQQLDDPDFQRFLDQVKDFREMSVGDVGPQINDVPRGIVHHDANPSNVLFNKSGDLVALLDFDEAHESFLLTDVASIVHYWGMESAGDGLDIEKVLHLLSSYGKRRALLEIEVELLPYFILLFHLADAAEYVTRAIERDPKAHPVETCRSYKTFTKLLENRDWQDCLRRSCKRIGSLGSIR